MNSAAAAAATGALVPATQKPYPESGSGDRAALTFVSRVLVIISILVII